MSWLKGKRRKHELHEPETTSGPASLAVAPAEGDELEGSPLAQRLRSLDWPHPPEDVRERCLNEIMRRVEAGSAHGESFASGGSGNAA